MKGLIFQEKHSRTSKKQEKPSAVKKEHPALKKKMKYIDFLLFLWVIFALLYPDPDCEKSGSGSRDPIEYGSTASLLQVLFNTNRRRFHIEWI
jgi:hypothetical protein